MITKITISILILLAIAIISLLVPSNIEYTPELRAPHEDIQQIVAPEPVTPTIRLTEYL